ncbi:uncharacterized protein LOC109799279 [Cajanus cajan]|uniref:uncharacterized protein LOC109799279 n=1 Tax=Cajanus cajan TaxID=3821 RepID=UPI00098DC61B|nr:uncharacterized protein LOC109799279 [Cajanus cajan]
MAEEGLGTHNGGDGPAIPPRRTLGDYAQQHGPRHFSSIAVPNTSIAIEMKPAFLTLVSSQQFAGLDHEDPYSHLSNFYELCGTMGIPEGDEEAVYLRFYPSSKYIKAKLEITTFRQGADEPFFEAWERFKSLLRKCPNHGFEDIAQLNFFVNGIKPEVKMLLDAAAGGTMMSIEALTKQMAKIPQQLHAIASSPAQSNSSLKCDFCGGDHPNGHCSKNSNEEEGNQGWKNNNNQGYGWKNEAGPSNRPPSQQQQQHQPVYPSMHERTSKLDETLNQFMQVSMNNQKNTEASINNLEVQVGQLAKQLADMSGGPFSANSKTNPKEYCQAITTRSGKVVGSDVGVSEKNEKKENVELREVEEECEKNEEENDKNESKEKERQFLRFLDIIKKLQINIPFTEAMEQMPTYARFMKELLTKKRKILKEETMELEAGCSAIIQKSLPQKSRDPGSFTLPVSIGNLSVGKALLDLGANINLMPLSMLKKIGEVEVRPTRMTLQLADRSIKFPHGIVEDMIVKVDKFMFPVDFIVMDMEEDVEVPLILGRPFMKTTRVIIDMDDGKPKDRVQDEEVSFNVFETTNFPKGNKDWFRIDVLDDVYLETQNDFKSSSPLEKALPISNEELDKVIGKACHLPMELEHKAFRALKALNYDLKAVGEKRKLQLHELEEMKL